MFLNLNNEQKQAVEHFEGCCTVISVPGSGKTKTLTSRVIRLIERGVNPENILCITFTNKAANEMKTRIAAQIGSSKGLWISTFHKLCVSVIRKYAYLVDFSSDFTILDENDQKSIMKKVARMHGYNIKDNEIGTYCRLANRYREDLIPYKEFIETSTPEQALIVSDYLSTIHATKCVDFSGLLYLTHKILENEDARKRLNDKFKFVLGDEYQDTNVIQNEIVMKIASHGNLFVVLDPSQSIFGFTGSKPENVKLLYSKYPDTKTYVLPKNYRSTSKILKTAEKLIRCNPESKNVVLESTRNEGEDIRLYQFMNPDAESTFVAETIKQLKDDGIPLKEMAVLYRSNAQSKSMEQRLTNSGIPYKIVGGFGFFDRKEVKDVIAYLTLAANPFETCAFHRAISFPKRGIGDIQIGKIEKACKEHNKNIFQVVNDHINEIGLTEKGKEELTKFCSVYKSIPSDLVAACKYLIQQSGYLDYLDTVDDKEKSRRENLFELLNGIEQFRNSRKNPKIIDYLRQITLESGDDKSDEDENRVKLSSIHASKGGEWEVVFIIGAEEKLLPHYLCLSGDNPKKGEEEERRLMYVAVTRSKSKLYITYNKFRTKQSFYSANSKFSLCEPSRFLKEMGLLIDNKKHVTFS